MLKQLNGLNATLEPSFPFFLFVEEIMEPVQITSAVQRGSYVYAYNRSRQLFGKPGTLVGYTSNSLSVQRGNYVYVYNEKGSQIAAHYTK